MTQAMLNGLLLALVTGLAAGHAGAAEPPSAATEPAAHPTAGYDKGFFLGTPDGNYRLLVNARVQARYAYEALEDAADLNAFSIPRARLKLAGHVATKRLTYAFQADFAKGTVALKDFYVDYAFVPDWFHVRAGQSKRPFSRQQLASSGKLALVDRARTDEAFGAGRDIGLAFGNDCEKSPPFEWALGLFNGTGEKPWFSGTVSADTVTRGAKFTNVPAKFYPMLVVRLGYNYGGIQGYTESDFEGGPPRFGLGLSGQLGFDTDGGHDGTLASEFDAIFKAYGFATSGGVYLRSGQNGSAWREQDFAAVGAHWQAGYLIAGFVEPALRYTFIGPDGTDNDLHEVTAGLSVYFWKRHVQWQSDASWLRRAQAPGERTNDWIVRSQVQFAL